MNFDDTHLSEEQGRRHRFAMIAPLTGWTVVALAAVVMTGWVLRVPWMVQIIPGTAGMVFANALCMFLLGIALALTTVERRWCKPTQTLIGIGVLLVGATVLVQYRFDLALPPLDLAGLHRWLNNNPGRMAPNTALAHVLAGLTALLIAHARPGPRAIATLVGAFAVAMLGITGLVGHQLRPELLYGWHIETRMALHTATAFVLLGIGYATAIYRKQRLGELFRRREDLRVGLLGGGLMVFVGLVGGLAAFILLQEQMGTVLRNGLQLSFNNRQVLIAAEIPDKIKDVRDFANRPGIQRELARLRAAPDDRAALQFINTVLSRHVTTGPVSGRLFDARGRLLTGAGPANDAVLELPLVSAGGAKLLWNGQLAKLRAAHPIVANGVELGQVELVYALPVLTDMVRGAQETNLSGEMQLCAKTGQVVRCLPMRLAPARTELPVVAQAGPTPIARALAAESGVMLDTDHRGERVLAVYGPVGDLGLGMVLKVDVAEIYAPVRQRFEFTLLVIMLIIAAGILLLRARLVPLVRQLAHLEQRWQFALEGAGDGVWDWNLVTNEVFFSRQWKQMLGYQEHEIGGSLDEWDRRVHPDDKARTYADIERHLKGEAPHYQNEHRVLCKDGSYKWILDRGMVVARDANGKPTRMIGTHTDISERKQAEETIRELSLVDDLTGLRNRRGFFLLGESQLSLAQRLGSMAVLYFVDVDGLKRINDDLGHEQGDRALTEIAELLRATFRETDIIARLGGDEFVVLALEASGVDTAASVARFEAQLSQHNRSALRPYRLAASMGVAWRGPGSAESLAELVARADTEMYRVKQQRRKAS